MRQGLGGLRVFPGKHFRHLAIWEKLCRMSWQSKYFYLGTIMKTFVAKAA